jgi:hypothetical protein
VAAVLGPGYQLLEPGPVCNMCTSLLPLVLLGLVTKACQVFAAGGRWACDWQLRAASCESLTVAPRVPRAARLSAAFLRNSCGLWFLIGPKCEMWHVACDIYLQGISPQFPGVLVGPPHVRKCHQMSSMEWTPSRRVDVASKGQLEN